MQTPCSLLPLQLLHKLAKDSSLRTLLIYSFLYNELYFGCAGSVAVSRLPLVVTRRLLSTAGVGFSLRWLLWWRHTGWLWPRAWLEQDQGLSSCPRRWLADEALGHHGSPQLSWSEKLPLKLSASFLSIRSFKIYYRCIGTVQHLKSKYGKGYFLEIKLKDWIEDLEVDRLQREVQCIFPNASRQER